MSDQETFDVDHTFRSYRESLAHLQVAGPSQVRRTVLRRRRRNSAVGSALALVLVAGSATGYLTWQRGPERAEPGPPRVSASVDATGPTSVPSPTPSGSAPASDGRISRQELLATPVDLPSWRVPQPRCQSGPQRLVERSSQDGAKVLEGLDYADVDGDGRMEALALVRCVVGTHGPGQVIAIDRDPGGRVVTLGPVVQDGKTAPQWLLAVDGGQDGTVRVEMADIAPGGGWPLAWSQRQWRTYRWNGTAFRQVAGPTSFGPNPHVANVSVTASDLVWSEAPAAPGIWTGTLKVTIRNSGATVAGVEFRLQLPPQVVADVDGWAGCAGADHTTNPITCRLGTLTAGAEWQLALDVRSSADPGTGRGSVWVGPLDRSGDFLGNDGRAEAGFNYR